MGIKDNDIEGYRKRWYIPARDFGVFTSPIGEQAGTGSIKQVPHLLKATPQLVWGTQSEGDGAGDDLVFGTHEGTNIVGTWGVSEKQLFFAGLVNSEFSTFGFGGFHIATVGDLYTTYQRPPWDIDVQFPMGFKVNYISGSSTAADIFDWIVLLDFVAENVALAAPTTALDTAIDIAGTLGTAAANLNNWSSRGIKNKEFLTRAQIEAGALMTLSIELDSTGSDLPLEECHFLGVEVDYVPQRTVGDGNWHDLPLQSDGAQ